ncbi:hypothetical protein [Bdellovibrio sp. HCB337]|uniref:hypothetical protein n=1 Tax=Bdellovibrio sp. HCB337 TaxID=3394358 RepID=UPI0039A71208
MRFAILLSLSFLLSNCSSTQDKDTTKSLPASIVTAADTAKPAFEKIQYISEFKQKDKVVASANLSSDDASIGIKFIAKDLSKGTYVLLLINDNCQNIQGKLTSIQKTQVDGENTILISEFTAKKDLNENHSIEAKGGVSPKDYLANRYLAIYSASKKSSQYTFISCENRQ